VAPAGTPFEDAVGGALQALRGDFRGRLSRWGRGRGGEFISQSVPCHPCGCQGLWPHLTACLLPQMTDRLWPQVTVCDRMCVELLIAVNCLLPRVPGCGCVGVRGFRWVSVAAMHVAGCL
jgi:hypothetical protein